MSNTEQAQKEKKFLGLDMRWLQKHNSGPILVETVDQFWSKLTHRGAVTGHLSSAPHSHAVFDSATAADLGGSCRRQPCPAHRTGAVPAARLWARRTITYHNIEAGCSADQQAYTSVSSTGHMKAVDTINGIQTVE